jgi:hypothetical protein
MTGELRNLVTVLDQQIVEADTRNTETGSQRERNHVYYSMGAIGNEQTGRSHYVDPAVMDTVESKKAFFRETFFSGRKPVKFRPTENESQQQADAKTAYVERQLENNNWFQVFRDCLHDAFVAKRCVLHVEWEEDEDATILQAVQAQPQHIQWQIQQVNDVIDVDMEAVQQNPDGTLTGNIRLIADGSRVKLRLIAPEKYYRDPYAAYPEDCAYCCFADEVTRSELLRQGIDPAQIDTLSSEYRHRSDEEDNARKAHDSSWTRMRKYSRSDELELITTYWTYSWLDLSQYMDGAPEEPRLYKIRWAKNEILRYADEDGETRYAIDEVSEMPFFEWSQYKISHAANSMCDADVLAPLQKQLSTFKRLIIDNQQMANTSRWLAQEGGVRDMRSLLDTTIGGVVRVRSPDAVAPLPVPPLSPAAMAAVEMLETDKESRSGNTRLSKGMNKDAMSEQNASSMIERLTNSANKRIAGEARDFAESFLVPVMRHIYKLGVRHDYRTYQLEVAGKQMQAAPQQWSEPAPHAEVAVALTPDESAKRAMSLLQLHQMMSMDPMVGQLYGITQKHAMFDELFDLFGVTDASRFLMSPDSPEFLQSQEQMLAQQQQEQQQLMAQQMFQQQLMQSADTREWKRVEQDQQKNMVDFANIASDNEREDEKLDHTKVYDFAKLGVERSKVAKSNSRT